MNLLTDPWLPFKCKDGRLSYFPVTAIVDPNIVDLALPRADFQGAAYQFLIGLLQTAMAPDNKEGWVSQYETPPEKSDLEQAMSALLPAFEIDTEAAAFMQDRDLLAAEKTSTVAGLLIDSPGASTVKKNTDHFVKADRVEQLCECCAAMSLFTLQINAPSGGQGHRTGLRGGGPLTTLVMPGEAGASLWQRLWLNILDRTVWSYTDPAYTNSSLFPWLGDTRTSEKGQGTFPEDVHPLHVFWAAPRRIRMLFEDFDCRCDLCGRDSSRAVRSIRTRNYGSNYDGPWTHPLTPYRFDPKKPDQPPYSRKAQPDGLNYRHWEALVMTDEKERGHLPAKVILDYAEKWDAASDDELDLPSVAGLWVFGYDMDKMKARCWYASHMPLQVLPDQARTVAQIWLREMVDLTSTSAELLQAGIKEAWFGRPKEGRLKRNKEEISFIGAALWEATEQQFYSLLMELGTQLNNNNPPQRFPAEIAAQWYRSVTHHARELFDDFALSGPAEQLNMKRITVARNDFRKDLHNGKMARNFRKMGQLNISGKPEAVEAK